MRNNTNNYNNHNLSRSTQSSQPTSLSIRVQRSVLPQPNPIPHTSSFPCLLSDAAAAPFPVQFVITAIVHHVLNTCFNLNGEGPFLSDQGPT